MVPPRRQLPAVLSDTPQSALAPIPILTEQARADVAGAINSRRAQGTRTLYRAAWLRFAAWCEAEQHQPLPAHPQSVAAYITALAREPTHSLSKLRLARAAIGFMHGERFPEVIPPTASPLVQKVMEGLGRELGRPPKKKAAAVAEIILQMLQHLPSDAVHDRALLLVGFATAMRRSELVSIQLEHLTVTETGYDILIPRSKTDQQGQGQYVPISRNDGVPDICPVTALQAWLVQRQPTGFIFAHSDGAHISTSYVVRLIKRLASKASLDPKLFAGHSLRRGHLTQSALDGTPEFIAQRQARHANANTTRGYFDDVIRAQQNSSMNLGKSLLTKKVPK